MSARHASERAARRRAVRGARRVRSPIAALVLFAPFAATAHADDTAPVAAPVAPTATAAPAPSAPPEPAQPEPTPDPWSDVEGSIRAGFRLVSGEGEGRFQQDRSIDDGPRVFDFEMRGGPASSPAKITDWEVSAHGLGDANEDARLRFRRDDLLDVSAGWMRDDYSYRATGDGFPYDTIRERGDLKIRAAPSRDLTLRLDWNHNLRRGDAYTIGDTDRRPFPPPANVDPDFVNVHRPLHQEYDAFTAGADLRAGKWRFSLSETARLSQIDDTRTYDVPAALRGPDPVREGLRRQVRSTAWTTVAKAGVTALGGDLDVDLIGSFTHQPVDSRVGGSANGVAGANGPYTATFDGDNSLRRDVNDLRSETLWRVGHGVEIAVGLERDDQHDDASLRLVERRDFANAGVPTETFVNARDARITNRGERASGEVSWDATDELRLRLGEEYYRQTLQSPDSSRGSSLLPTDFASKTFRTIVGADWKPMRRLDLHALAKVGRNDDPHATPGAEDSDEFTFRGRWKATDELSMTSVWRHRGYRHSADFDSASRTDSATVAGAWTPGAWTVSPSFTWQNGDTRTDTTYLSTAGGGGFQTIADQVSFQTRDLIASLDLRCAFTKTLRAHLTGTRTDAGGGYEAVWHEVALGAEYDLSPDFTIGADLLSWRLDEGGADADDYSVLGVELSATWRF